MEFLLGRLLGVFLGRAASKKWSDGRLPGSYEVQPRSALARAVVYAGLLFLGGLAVWLVLLYTLL